MKKFGLEPRKLSVVSVWEEAILAMIVFLAHLPSLNLRNATLLLQDRQRSPRVVSRADLAISRAFDF